MQRREEKFWLIFFAIAGTVFLTTRAILDSPFAHSALFYLAVPFTISMLIGLLTSPPSGQTLGAEYLRELRTGMIFMLGTSAFLFEGFLCVLFVIPIYLIALTAGFLFKTLWLRHKNNRSGRLKASLIPLVVAVMAVEGLSPSTSLERQNSVTQSLVINAPIETLKANMARAIDLPTKRPLYLSIFPLPVDAQAGSLSPGDIHKLSFLYKRWFFTNTHSGEFHLRIDEVGHRHVKTSVVKNTSYFEKYLSIQGTRVTFTERSDGQTEVNLTVNYERKLDPFWYFGPLQTLAVEQSADYLIKNIICRELCDAGH